MASTFFEAWVTRLRVAWMGVNAQRIFGGFAAALGDKMADRAQQGVLEHLPAFASDPRSVALIASERQLDTYPSEPVAGIASRAPYWLQINRFRGRPLGVLLGLHFAGFDGAVIIQANGRAFSLTLPLPPFDGAWDPTPNLVKQSASIAPATITSELTPPTRTSAGRSIPAGTAWARFDDNTDMTSRFVVVFPSGLARTVAYGKATFTGAEDGSALHPWPTASWATPFPPGFTGYDVMPGVPKLTGGDTFSVYCSADATSKSSSGVKVIASESFVGTVDVKAVRPLDVASLEQVVKSWKNKKSTCVGICEYLTAAGSWGWPKRKWGDGTKWGATKVNQLVGSFS